jgi:CspA family cold shock protein
LRRSNERTDPNGERSGSDKDVVSTGQTSVGGLDPVKRIYMNQKALLTYVLRSVCGVFTFFKFELSNNSCFSRMHNAFSRVKKEFQRGEKEMKGNIKRWFDYKGYGFIDVEGQEKDMFVHTSDIKGFSSPKIGDEVEFEVRESEKGPRAVNVEIA